MKESKIRKANIELLRIVLMLLIVAHHYVVNSGITSLFDNNNITINMVYLQFLGFAGKIGINCFVLITGYFMITSNITLKKFLKLFLEVKFYTISIYFIFVITRYQEFLIKDFIKIIFYEIFWAGKGFSSTYIIFFLFIPFINILLNNLNKRKHKLLIILTLFYFSIISTFTKINDTWNYLGWLITVYIVGAYIRLYPNKYFISKKLNIITFLIFSLLAFISILIIDYLNLKVSYYYFVNEAHKLLAILIAVSLFLIFNNLEITYSKIINTISRATFGVLLIHASSDTMRTWLWKDVLNNVSFYNSDYLILHSIISTFGVYIICNIIDQIRIEILEKNFFKHFDKKINKIDEKIKYYIQN